MIRRISLLAAIAVALAGCATTNSVGYADGNYQGANNGGYYAAAQGGSGDYYFAPLQIVVNQTGPANGGNYNPAYGLGYEYMYQPWWLYGPRYGSNGGGHREMTAQAASPNALYAANQPQGSMMTQSAMAHASPVPSSHDGTDRTSPQHDKSMH